MRSVLCMRSSVRDVGVDCERAEKVEVAVEEGGEGPRVEVELLYPLFHVCAQRCARFLPLRPRPVGVGEGNAMVPIADLIHEPESGIGEEAFPQVIFDDDLPLRHARHFTEEAERVFRVVEDIDEERAPEAFFWEGEVRAVECCYRDCRVWAYKSINAVYRDVRSLCEDGGGYAAVAAPDIEHRGVVGEEIRDTRAEDAYPPHVDVPIMEVFHPSHEGAGGGG